jgi:putative CocE/NonD family hydrolase
MKKSLSVLHSLTAVALALLTSVSFTALAAADQASEPTAATAQRWGVPPFFSRETPETLQTRWVRRLTGYLKTRDGVELRYSVLLPKGRGPFPVVVNYSGYDPGAIGGYSYQHNNTAMSNAVDAMFLEHGYAVLGVNARGTGCSEGVFDFLGAAYGMDGADLVEWAGTQSWSNGAVGMANWSWAGMSQVATASERPPHLKAIAPGMALTDPRLDSWALGGVPSPGFITGWWMFLHSRWLAVRRSAEEEHDQRCLAQVERNYQSGQDPKVNLPTNLVRHPLRDEWLERRVILNKAQRIEVPLLSMEAFQDEATTVRAGYYQELLDPQKLWMVQTNGNHDLYESRQFLPTLLAFFDHFVKGVGNGFERRPHVEVWQDTVTTGSERGRDYDSGSKAGWVYTRSSLPVAVETMDLPLAADHRLALPGEVAASSAADTYRYPVEGPTVDVNPYAPAWGEQQPGWQQGSLAYTSAPLSKPVVMYGPASADLWISSTESDGDVQVTLTEVRPDGQELFIQRGWLRLSDRRQDPNRSTALRPWPCDTPACIETLVPEVPVLARVEIFKTGHSFRSGSRIRLWIDTPSATGGNSFNHSALPATMSVWHDANHASKLVLGTLRDVSVPLQMPACGSVLMQPCRPDPLTGASGN